MPHREMSARSWQIAYDIANPRRLRRVERALWGAGERVHFSCFVCELTGPELESLQRRLSRFIDLEADTVRYTPLCASDRQATRHIGRSEASAPPDSWIV